MIGRFEVQREAGASYAFAMHPEQGVRFELRLEFAEGGGARYAVSLELPSGSHEGRAALAPSGELKLDWDGDAALPEWCIAAVRAQLRLLIRDHGKSGNYPRRLTRWRPEPAPVPGRPE